MATVGIYKRFVVLNGIYDNMPAYAMNNLIKYVTEQILYYKIDGIICSEFFIASKLREIFGNDIKISTSCNTNLFTKRQIYHWIQNAQIDIVNPPREYCRNLTGLKAIVNKDKYKIKLLINETCYLNCPYLGSHCMSKRSYSPGCFIPNTQDSILKFCAVTPQTLDILDPYVDIYKITGRFASTEYIFKMLDLYRDGIDCWWSELFGARAHRDIRTKDIPNSLIFCNGTCDTCTQCSDTLKLFVEKKKDE